MKRQTVIKCGWTFAVSLVILSLISLTLSETKTPEISPTTRARIDSYLNGIEKAGFTGTVLVERDGRVLVSRAFGMRDVAGNIRNDMDTVFDIGSLTKQFTAAAILKLEMHGRLSTEDTISNIEQVFGGSGNDTLIGDSLANRFESGAGDDFLRGGGGIDFMDGGSGIDTADYSDKSAAVSATLAGAGVSTVTVGGVAEDTIRNVENLIGGSANDTLTGSTAANRLDGNTGSDVLMGGTGADTFVFSTALGPTNIDSILDFAVGVDRIALDDAIFSAFAGQASVGVAAFHIGSAAHDADDRIVYDSANGSLYYDADGMGGGAATPDALRSGAAIAHSPGSSSSTALA